MPTDWKKACTALVHKKGKNNVPSNFRPIALEPVPLKVFTSCPRDSIFTFLKESNFIEAEIQKGFTPKLSGVLEHTSKMVHIINKARTKQRSVVITLLDLKNASGEVHHNLISEVLCYQHVSSLYENFHTFIITDEYTTPAIPVGIGVLQGECLSPLLFSMCFNTVIKYLRQEKYIQFRFSPHDENGRLYNPTHWS